MTELKSYWVYCHKCKRYTALKDLKELPHYEGSFRDFSLLCSCGGYDFVIERIGKERHPLPPPNF